MEADQLPTKPGPYYWRKSDEDEWTRVFNVRLSNSIGLCVDEGFYHESVEHRGGQWLPIPTADELVKLQATKKMVDEGQDAFMAFDKHGRVRHLGDVRDYAKLVGRTWQELAEEGYTCELVTIIKEEK